MKKHTLSIVVALFMSLISYGQSWEKLFSHQSTDVFRCVQEVSAGGYIAAGYTADSTANDTDAFVVRVNTNGDTLWTYSYNGGKKDLFYKIIETASGDFVALGYTNSVTGISDDILYVGLTSNGHEQWVKTWGANGTEHGQDIVETNDGYTIAGYTTPQATYYDALIIHTDFNGAVLWTKTIGTADYEDANAIRLLPDGGYIVGGQGRSNGDYDMLLMRLNSSGDTIWTKTLGTSGIDNIESICLMNNGYVLAGGTTDPVSGNNGYIVATDTSGTMQWSKIYGGDDQDDFHRIEPTNDGGFILAGTCTSYGPANPNMWLFKTDANGDSLWARTFGGDSHDHGYSAVQTSDGGYILAGHSGSFGYQNEDAYLVKTDGNGTPPNNMQYVRPIELVSPICTGQGMQDVKITVRNFGHTTETNVHLTVDITGIVNQTLNATIASIAPQTFQVVTLTPQINTSPGGGLNFDAHTDVPNDVYPAHNSFSKSISTCTSVDEAIDIDYDLYPNPATTEIRLDFPKADQDAEITIVDMNGRILKSVLSRKGEHHLTLNTSQFAAGIYMVKVTTADGFDRRMLIIGN